MLITKVYNDKTLRGEILLTPFKDCVIMLGRSFRPCSGKENTVGAKLVGLLKRVADFVLGFFGTIFTSLTVPVGLAIKYHALQTRITEKQNKSGLSIEKEKAEAKEKTKTEIEDTKETAKDQEKVQAKETSVKPVISEPDSPDSKPVKSLSQSIDPAPESNLEQKASIKRYIEEVYAYPGDLTPVEKRYIVTSFSSDDVLSIFLAPGLKFSVRNQNLFESGAEVIVNAANTHLGGGGGIDGAIHQFGGAAYANAHKSLQKKYNAMYPEGFASLIDSGELKAKHKIDNVIVVAGPQGAFDTKKAAKLYSCYLNSLALAQWHSKKSIAFPSISTGNFGFPKDYAAQIVLRAVYDFTKVCPTTTLKEISVHFLENDPAEDFGYYLEALKKS